MRIVTQAGALRLARGLAVGALSMTLCLSPAAGQTGGGMPVTVQLSDLTRTGTNYMAGDSFRLVVSGPPDEAVTIVATKDGVEGSEAVMGRTDASGNLRIDSVWNASDAGAYSQVWKVGGVQANPVLAFTVSEHSAAVELTDLTRTGTSYMAGDSFRLVVSGARNAKVTVTPTKDDVTGNETEMGQTDDSGNLTIDGVWHSSDAGIHSQIWKVDGVPAGPALSFAIGQRTTTVELSDRTHTGTAYMAGDSFRVVVSGAPNETVTNTTTTDGVEGSPAVMGTTDASGNLTIDGVWSTSDAGSYKQVWNVGTAAAPALSFDIAPHTTTVQLTDETRKGAYTAGDSFRMVVSGMPNGTVTVVQTKDGAQGDEAVIGKTDASGNLTIEGTWNASETGAYKQVWKVDGVPAAPELSFSVGEHTTAVELTDLTRTGSNYMTGDSYQLVISGPANQTVTNITTKDGVEGQEVVMGKTDASGNLTITGVWNASEAGAYTQVWKVGGETAPVVTFSIAQHTTAVELRDKTRDGTDYMTGDSFRVVVSGPPNQTVRLTSSKDGAEGSEVVMGQTDGAGNLAIDGAWAPSEAGSYTQVWKVGGTQASPLSFTITPRPAAVELNDLTSGTAVYTVGDSFQLVVSGDPNQTVTVSQSKDGSEAAAAVAGKTDASGKLTITGAWGASEAGAYTQVWSVGAVQAAGLSFSVAEAQAQ